REAERLLQRTRAELLGRNMWVEFPDGRGSAFEAAYALAARENHAVEIEEFYPPLDAWLEVRIYPSHQGLTIYFRDVSERRRSQDEILRLNADLELRVRQRTAQLELANGELEAFSYSVAHDLRAPLAAISGFAHALETELGASANPRVRHYLDRAREGVRQTGEMIDALLSLARLSRAELRWERVDLGAMARTALEDLRQREPQGDAVLTVQDGLVVEGDPRLLQLVADNLVGNAWKFSAHQACRTITVGLHPAGDGEKIYFVRDNGVGFDMAHAANLFGAFQRLHSQAEFPGTGVGLANVRRITSRHSGRIWAESQPGQGATFYFTLGEAPA
ncbi:MAG: ATP-binding protein, partial [Ramlibacter sp.]